MTGERPHPTLHSNAAPTGDGRLSAPSATRNAPAIVKALVPLMPAEGVVLEIASGTGEHAVALARALPGCIWQPSDIAPERLVSIDAWRAAEGVANMRVAIALDATRPDWAFGPVAAVYLSNLLHLLPTGAGENVVSGAARSLRPGGRFFIYGPFREGGRFRSEGDARFHDSLTRSDPEIGYKDVEWVLAVAAAAGLKPLARIEMPANNLILAFERPAT